VGRPELRLLEDTENDLLELKMKRWRQKANNREERELAIKVTLELRCHSNIF
jgi:hypothetical protein